MPIPSLAPSQKTQKPALQAAQPLSLLPSVLLEELGSHSFPPGHHVTQGRCRATSKASQNIRPPVCGLFSTAQSLGSLHLAAPRAAAEPALLPCHCSLTLPGGERARGSQPPSWWRHGIHGDSRWRCRLSAEQGKCSKLTRAHT